MKKLIIGSISIIFLIIAVIIIVKLITPVSSITIKNSSGEAISNVTITYENNIERIGVIENKSSKNISISTKSEIGVTLSYISADGINYKSRKLYMEPRGYHIAFIVYPKGEIKEDLKLKY